LINLLSSGMRLFAPPPLASDGQEPSLHYSISLDFSLIMEIEMLTRCFPLLIKIS